MNRRRVALLVACGLSFGGCFPRELVDRGPTADVSEHHDELALEALMFELLSRGDVYRAFHVVEYAKSLRIAGAITAREEHGGTSAPDDERFWGYEAMMQARIEVARAASVPYASVIGARYLVATADEISRSLVANEAIVSYYIARNELHAFVATSRGFVHLLLARDAGLAESAASALVEGIQRRASDWRVMAERVSAIVLAPVLAVLPLDIEILRIASDGSLARVPFGALPLDNEQAGALLADQLRVTYLPTASFHTFLLQRPTPLAFSPRVLAIGNPTAPGPEWRPLPQAETEARLVARIFDGSTLLVGADATEERIHDLFRGFDVLHFAAHGVLPTTGAPPALVLATTPFPRASRPDGYLAADEILRMDLTHCHLVVLSACDTSVSFGGQGGGSLASITGAFLAAGAPTVIGSLWSVADDGTAHLMLELYRRFANMGPVDALLEGSAVLRDDARFGHPYYWAAFVAFGRD